MDSETGYELEMEEIDELALDKIKLEEMAKESGQLEHENRGLLEEIRVLRSRLLDEKADQSDVYYYLHKKLDDNYDVISALERQLMIEAADREKAETEYSRQIDELEHRKDEELAPLKEKLITVEEQVNSMHEAAEHKKESDSKRARLQREAESTEYTVESDLNVERRKKLQEKQRVRRQIEEQIEKLSVELFSKKEVELADKTVRAADNNVKLHAALQAKAKQAERMMIVNQGLASENSSLRNDVDLAKASEEVLRKRVTLYHDLVVRLKAQLEQQAACVNDDDKKKLNALEQSLDCAAAATSDTHAVNESKAGLDTMSFTSGETRPSSPVIWAGGACEGLVYESVDELRVAVDSLKRLHAQLHAEEEKLAADLACRRRNSAITSENALGATLLQAAESWMMSQSTGNRQGQECGEGGTYSDDEPPRRVVSNLPSLPAQRQSNNDPHVASSRRHAVTPSKKRGRTTHAERRGRSKPQEGHTHEVVQSKWNGSTGPSAPGLLARVANSSRRRRDLFFTLVHAFRDQQQQTLPAESSATDDLRTTATGTRIIDGESRADESEMQAAGSIDEADITRGLDDEEAPRTSADVTNHGDVRIGGGISASDLSSMSVRTLSNFVNSERRCASTQTVAKHFPEKFAVVPPARRLVVSSTFLTSKSVSSTSTARSAWPGTTSVDSRG